MPETGQPAEFWLVRHGQTDWNIQRRYQGHKDIPLNAAGREQARVLAADLNDASFAAVYSSDLSRAVETAAILTENQPMTIITDLRLREIAMGDWEGRTLAEVSSEHPGSDGGLVYTEVHSRAPGGESLAEVAARVRAFADEIAAKHPGQVVLVVSHGLLLAALRCLAVGLPLAEARDIVPENCSVVRVYWPHPLVSEP
ncbi:MAG: histidine phosphatase family protein [Bellilinea sp.]